jgi:hypothetical protein|tara:strand:+ start:3697 stop:4185 length:489 start_codon:yes stop_codon:yes gene_type:complete
MKKILLMLSLAIMFSCEDENEDSGSGSNAPLVGKWNMTSMGDYENANCSGNVDNSGWAFMQSFFSQSLEFKSDGTVAMSISAFGINSTLPGTWTEDKDQFCLMGDCIDFTINGDKLSYNEQSEAYCEDSSGNETGETTQSSCESAGNDWYPASCALNEFTKE